MNSQPENPIQIYNSLVREKEPFQPLKPPQVSMYVCGPTVYDEPHIGHARSAYIFDVIRRYLDYRGYKVKFVRNVTDVDDKIIEKAGKEYPGEELNSAVAKVAGKYLDQYHEELGKLGISTGAPEIIEPKASEYIAKMIEFIKRLIEKGAAYPSEGDVYFDITKARDYGKLSHQSPDKMEIGARVAPGEKKKNPLDFALWKSAKENEPSWDSPWGKGRPGWHIECSAMSSDILGDQFDIHGGGIDLIFPHHENEIAQSEGAGKPFARYWIHHGLLTINGQKMSKSLGNFVTVKKALANLPKDHAADIVKDFFLRAHYSSPIDHSNEAIDEAKMEIYRFSKTLTEEDCPLDENMVKMVPEKYKREINNWKIIFRNNMDDDFNTPRARADICEIVRYCNYLIYEYKKDSNPQLKYAISYARKIGRELSGVLGLSLRKVDDHDTLWGDSSVVNIMKEEEININIEERSKLKKEKKYSEADRIRKELEKQGIILEDSKDGKTTWRRKI